MKNITLPLMLLVGVCLAGCSATVTAGQPSQLQQLGSLALIDAARIGVTAELAPRVEQAYTQGKVTFAEYTTMRAEESAALAALAGLRTKVVAGQAVTQQDIADAESTFVVPLQNLVAQCIPVTLPPAQTAK